MSFFEIIGTILIGPLKLLFEVIYSMAFTMIQDPGIAIIALSLAMNIFGAAAVSPGRCYSD